LGNKPRLNSVDLLLKSNDRRNELKTISSGTVILEIEVNLLLNLVFDEKFF
jgi:hypothetical protein